MLLVWGIGVSVPYVCMTTYTIIPRSGGDGYDIEVVSGNGARNKMLGFETEADVRIVAEQLARQFPATNQNWSVHVEPLLDGINGPYTPAYYRMMLGATLFVLMIVCANIANLQLARGLARRPDIAMRIALGASRWRVLRQLLTENLLLGMAGAAGGLAFGKDQRGTPHQLPPDVRQFELLRRAHDQTRADPRLDPADRLRDGRFRQPQLRGRCGERTALRDLRENGKAFQVGQICHEMSIAFETSGFPSFYF